jgi:hypothetical protein
MLTNSQYGSKLTYAKLHVNNEVLFKTNIVRGEGIALNGAYYSDHVIGTADVIDTNQNYQADMRQEPAGFLRKRLMYTEPVLSRSISELQDIARTRNEDILTSKSLGQRVNAQEYGVDVGRTAFQDMNGDFDVRRGAKSLDRLARDLVRDESDVEWAISPFTREFIVFKPKPGMPAAPVEPLQVKNFETDEYSLQSVSQSGDTPLNVYIHDMQSLMVDISDGEGVELVDGCPDDSRVGVADILRKAKLDSQFDILGVRVLKGKGDSSEHEVMVHDNARYYQYSSETGFSQGELGS